MSLITSTLYTRLLVDELGVEGFGIASLIVGITWIQPVLTDGSRTVVVKTIASQAGQTPAGLRQLHRAGRVQLAIGTVVFAIAGLCGLVAAVFFGPEWAGAVLLVGVSVAVSSSVSPGLAVLQGLGRQAAISLLPIPVGVLSLGLLIFLQHLGSGVAAAASGPIAGSIIAALVLGWTIRSQALPRGWAKALVRKSKPSGEQLTWVATLYSAVSVLFFMSDRYVIAGVGEGAALAALTVLQQIATPLISLTGTVGDGLWALVERRRALGSMGTGGALRVQLASAAVGVALGFVVVVSWPIIGAITLGAGSGGAGLLAGSLGLLVAASGVRSGAAALMRTRQGLRTLTFIWACSLMLKISLMVCVAHVFGSQAAVLAGVLVFIGATVATVRGASRTLQRSDREIPS